ncbi:MAG: hypothetical protein LBG95_05175 [Treponema sp.]|jgi:hypothetical protein|nr:hypothetical protein [Treponema sp.]
MGRGIFKALLEILEKKGASLPDSRKKGHNFRYKLSDALKCAFFVFFFQHPSMLDFQRKMQEDAA